MTHLLGGGVIVSSGGIVISPSSTMGGVGGVTSFSLAQYGTSSFGSSENILDESALFWALFFLISFLRAFELRFRSRTELPSRNIPAHNFAINIFTYIQSRGKFI
jgi:hypothetical protein